MPTQYTLPICVHPLDDEPLWFYLRYLSDLTQTHLDVLLPHLGLTAAQLDKGSKPEDAERLRNAERTLQLPPGGLDLPEPATTRFWTRTQGSRYCPDCLVERDGRWVSRWSAPWAFVCVEHQRLLRDACPTCNTTPTSHGHGVRILTSPSVCRKLISRSSPGPWLTNACGTDLRDADTLFDSEPAGDSDGTGGHAEPRSIDSQVWLELKLGQDQAHAVVNGQSLPRAWVHADVHNLLLLALRAHPADRTCCPPPVADALSAPRRGLAAHGLLNRADVQAHLTAVIAPALTAPTLQEAGANLRPLLNALREGEHLKDPAAVLHATLKRQRTSPWLQGLLLVALDTQRRALTRLRTSSTSERPLLPADTRYERPKGPDFPTYAPSGLGTRVTLTPDMIPTLISTETVLHAADEGELTAQLVMTASLLIVGTDLVWQGAFEALSIPFTGKYAEQIWRRWAQQETATTRTAIVCDLVQHLAATSQRVDWARRRRTWPTAPPLSSWGFNQHAKEEGIKRTSRAHRMSGALAWEILSGTPAALHPLPAGLLIRERSDYQQWKADQSPASLAWHAGQAERHLLAHRINEPTTLQLTRTGGDWTELEPYPRTLAGWGTRAHLRQGTRTRTGPSRADLERFAILAAHSSATEAASETGIRASLLTASLRRLEAQPGSRLINRAERARPQSLTPAGRALLQKHEQTP